MTPEQALAALQWLAAMGADEAVGEAPVNRFVSPAAAPDGPRQAPAAAPAVPAPLADRTADAEAAIAAARTAASQCASLADLAAALSRFEACPLSRTASRLAFVDGAQTPQLLVIGDTPAREDDEQGKPFAGTEGELLGRMLGAIGRGRDNSLLTNMVFWHPPGRRNPTEAEVAMCLPFLERLVDLVQPKAVLCLGTLPGQRLLADATGILKLRGKWGQWRGIPITVTWHPRELLLNSGFKADAWKDLLALKGRLDAALA